MPFCYISKLPQKFVENKSVTVEMDADEVTGDGFLVEPLTEHHLLEMFNRMVATTVGRVHLENCPADAPPWITELGKHVLSVSQFRGRRWEVLDIKVWVIPAGTWMGTLNS